ncbi:polysaccharide deacetylase family protein [Bacillus songklensis]|uniref:Polysaccharide deacetylase family protein n=1 Tax=Bacillus songklensis TaxID=1069116 RepID=A0ABV8B6S9_9BACI
MKRVLRPKKPFYILVGTILFAFFLILPSNITNGKAKESRQIHPTSLPMKQTADAEQLKKEINSLHQHNILSATLDINHQRIEKPIYFTFDDGPTKDTPYILDVLKKFHVKATFFMLDGQIKKYPEIAKRVVAEGHAVGCHGVSHDIHKIYAHDGSALQEMEQCSETLKNITNVDSSLIRVPFGSFPYLKEPHRSQLKRAHFQLWDWNVDSSDWDAKTPGQIVQNLTPQLTRLEHMEKTPVMLFHDKAVTAHSLDKVITFTQNSGFQPISISETMQPLQFRIR